MSGILAIPGPLLLSACNNPPTGLVSTSDEIELGRQAASDFEAKTPTRTDPFVSDIGMRIANIQPRKGLPWTYKVALTNDLNAFSLPGGFVYIYQGLLDAVHRDPDMVAATLGHESAHVVDRHAVKQMEQQMGMGLLISAVSHDQRSLQAVMGVMATLAQQGYSRQDEYQADHDGLILMHRAGYNPQGMVQLLETLQRLAPNNGGGLSKYLEDHPGTPSRIDRVRRQIAAGDI